MKWIVLLYATFLFFIQGSTDISSPDKEDPQLFKKEGIIDLHIMGDIKKLMKDRGDESSYHQMKLFYREEGQASMAHDFKIKTRGNFRRKRGNCKYPPLRLNFPKKMIPEGSIFQGQDKLKLVMPCKGDQFVAREYLAYKLYNQISPLSFKVRLVRLTFEDIKKNKRSKEILAFLIEDEDLMAKRNGGKIQEDQSFKPRQLEPKEFLRMSLFQYMIGNTDWSIQFNHNIKILEKEGFEMPIAVAYDFDHSGVVSAPYAHPAAALQMSSVQERRFRGYCMDMDDPGLREIIQDFLDAKEEVLKVIEEEEILESRDKKFLRKYIGEFYKTLLDNKKRVEDLSYPCNPNGTGNVVIRGLDN